MSKPIFNGIPIVWGNMPAPTLPDGWTLERTPAKWAKAISPSGKTWLIALDPPRLVRVIEERGFKTRCDFKSPVLLKE